jgi:hypothetical protein
MAAKAVPIEVCIKIDWSTDGARRYSKAGTIISPPPTPNRPAKNPENAPKSNRRATSSLII